MRALRNLVRACSAALILPCLAACSTPAGVPPAMHSGHSEYTGQPAHSAGQQSGSITAGTEQYRGFSVDNVFHSADSGDIHYNVYFPEHYDGNEPYALFLTLPGYQGLYRFGAGANLRTEAFGFEAQKYIADMIILAPQLNDWGANSADQAVALLDYFLEQYNIDRTRIYAEGYSGGGETLSLVMERCPELFAAVLHVSSVWDGELAPLAASRTPVYFVIGESDEYYGSARISETYHALAALYEAAGLPAETRAALAVLDVKDAAYFEAAGATSQHGGGGMVAYDNAIMSWLFGHSKEAL